RAVGAGGGGGRRSRRGDRAAPRGRGRRAGAGRAQAPRSDERCGRGVARRRRVAGRRRRSPGRDRQGPARVGAERDRATDGAGLEEVDAGAVFIGDRDVSDDPPKARDVAMVFQNYALYPYLTVAANIGFPLRIAKVPKRDREARVREVAKLLGLSEYLERKPA